MPEKPVDWKRVERLIVCGCTAEEIAPHFNMHSNTFRRRFEDEYGQSFSKYSNYKYREGHSLIKEKQFDKAMSGDNTLLIWLGKVMLGQRENAITNQSIQGDLKKFIDQLKKLNDTDGAAEQEAESSSESFNSED